MNSVVEYRYFLPYRFLKYCYKYVPVRFWFQNVHTDSVSLPVFNISDSSPHFFYNSHFKIEPIVGLKNETSYLLRSNCDCYFLIYF